MGGLDACFGRWDTSNHELADVHPQNFYKTLYPGQDYNNSRLMDFQTVDKFTSNALAIQDAGKRQVRVCVAVSEAEPNFSSYAMARQFLDHRGTVCGRPFTAFHREVSLNLLSI